MRRACPAQSRWPRPGWRSSSIRWRCRRQTSRTTCSTSGECSRKAELDGQVSVSASEVQDHLLDLWGRMPDSGARSQVERWLTETLVRNLYSVSDINERLETLLPAS